MYVVCTGHSCILFISASISVTLTDHPHGSTVHVHHHYVKDIFIILFVHVWEGDWKMLQNVNIFSTELHMRVY